MGDSTVLPLLPEPLELSPEPLDPLELSPELLEPLEPELSGGTHTAGGGDPESLELSLPEPELPESESPDPELPGSAKMGGQGPPLPPPPPPNPPWPLGSVVGFPSAPTVS